MDLWLLLIVMSLATYRVTRLVVADTFPPVLWLRDRLVGGWRPLTEKEREKYVTDVAGVVEGPVALPHPQLGALLRTDGEVSRYARRVEWSPFWLSELLSCPWCASGWVALGVTGGVWAVAGLAMPVLVWFAVWALGALLAGQEWA
jgi:hypothetical protein